MSTRGASLWARLPPPAGTRLSSLLALVAAVVVVLVAGGAGYPLVAGLTALGLLASALVTGHRFALALAGPALVATPGVAALAGADPAVVMVGVPAALVAWDAGERAVRLGTYGKKAVSPRVELLHAAGTVTVSLAAAVLISAARSLTAGIGSPLALALLLVGALALATALATSPD